MKTSLLHFNDDYRRNINGCTGNDELFNYVKELITKADYKQSYKTVALVNVDGTKDEIAEKVFAVSQNITSDWTDNSKVTAFGYSIRSTLPGDITIINGEAILFLGAGYKSLGFLDE